jgi:Protein of unknown function (DUF2281)
MTLKDLLLQEIETTPDSLLSETLNFLRQIKQQNTSSLEPVSHQRVYRQAGVTKGMFTMSDDFDAPLEDLKDYM